MRIAWYMGFGWASIVSVILCGILINVVGGWAAWFFYLPFLFVALYMTVRFRIYSTQAWRRVHSRIMIDYAKLASAEYDAAKKAKREFNIETPCRQLAEAVLCRPDGVSENLTELLSSGRKRYYDELVAQYPQLFLEDIDAARHKNALVGVRRDIASSRLGPDIVVAKAIERRHNKFEAARYLHALLLGRVR